MRGGPGVGPVIRIFAVALRRCTVENGANALRVVNVTPATQAPTATGADKSIKKDGSRRTAVAVAGVAPATGGDPSRAEIVNLSLSRRSMAVLYTVTCVLVQIARFIYSTHYADPDFASRLTYCYLFINNSGAYLLRFIQFMGHV